MKKRSLSISINLVFILVNALIWLVLGIIISLDAHPALPDSPSMKSAMAIISFFITAILGVLTFFLLRHNRIAYFLMLAFFIFTSALTIFDDFGLTDLLVLFISVVPIILLIKDRRWYLEANQRLEEVGGV